MILVKIAFVGVNPENDVMCVSVSCARFAQVSGFEFLVSGYWSENETGFQDFASGLSFALFASLRCKTLVLLIYSNMRVFVGVNPENGVMCVSVSIE